MAAEQTQTPQAGLAGKPAQPKGQPASGTTEPQPVFRDWAAI